MEQQTQQTHRLVTCWTLAALACWGGSLLLPGFLTTRESLPGFIILLFGLLFGWAAFGWAAYANLFFVAAATMLLNGRAPCYSIHAMIFLIATLPFFQGVVAGSSGGIDLVASWGWGAFLWLSAFVLLFTAAALRRGLLSPAGTRKVIVGLGVCLIATCVLRGYQISQANAQERAVYLSPGMAFTMAAFCGVELTPVDAPVVPPGSVVRLDVDPQLKEFKNGGPYFWLPRLSNDGQDGFSWVTWYRYPRMIKVQKDVAPDAPVLQVLKTVDGAVVRVLTSPGGRVLYEQPLRTISPLGGKQIYCPMSTMDGMQGMKIGYDTQVLRALGEEPEEEPQGSQTPKARPRETLRDEVARTPCSLGPPGLDGIEGLQLWDGRKVILRPDYLRTAKPGFCSDSYLVLVSMHLYKDHSNNGVQSLSLGTYIYDRQTLLPLAEFYAPTSACPHDYCEKNASDRMTAVRIDNTQIVIKSQAVDDLVAKRFER